MQDPTLLDNNSKQKTQSIDYQMIAFVLRGLERIRTAVEAFAELCLATRPQDHIDFVSMSGNCFRHEFGLQKYKTRAKLPKFF